MTEYRNQIWVVVFNPTLPGALESLAVGWLIGLRRKLLMDNGIELFVDDAEDDSASRRVWTAGDCASVFRNRTPDKIVHAHQLPDFGGEKSATKNLTTRAFAVYLSQSSPGYPGRSVVIPACEQAKVATLGRVMDQMEAGSSRCLREIIAYQPDGLFKILEILQ